MEDFTIVTLLLLCHSAAPMSESDAQVIKETGVLFRSGSRKFMLMGMDYPYTLLYAPVPHSTAWPNASV